MQTLRSGDYGDVLTVQFCGSGTLASANAMEITLRKPGYEPVVYTRQASLLDDDTHTIAYTTVSGEIDTPGVWQMQGYVETQAGAWHSRITYFRVLPSIS